MAKPEAVFIYVGTYPSKAAAEADYEVVKDLHMAGAVGTYDAAVVTKDDEGKIHENKDEMATRHGAWGGAAIGALIGCLFPPELIDDGQAALVIVGESKVAEAVDEAGLKADKQVARELDVKSKDIDKAVREAAGEVS
jgi:hypothetical protein